MSLFDPIRNYCERSGPGLWDEPLNAVSNIAFFIAAWALWKMYKKHPQPQGAGAVKILIFLIALVGVGSTLFHTFANGLAMLGDVIPIALFTFTYLWTVLRRLVLLSQTKTILALIAFAMVAALMSFVPPALRFNGSVDYFPCLGALVIVGVYLRKRDAVAASWILRGACWFTVSIICRSVDFQVCPSFPIGTHFIWHLMNGRVLYLLVKAIILF